MTYHHQPLGCLWELSSLLFRCGGDGRGLDSIRLDGDNKISPQDV